MALFKLKKINSSYLVFVVLVFFLAAAFYYAGGKNILSLPDKPFEHMEETASLPLPSQAPPEWPLAPDSREVTAVFAHYYFTGIIKEVNKTDAGGELILDTPNEKIPVINVSEQTRISRISLPYTSSTMRLARFGDLEVGMTVDISIEYDIRAKKWLVRDVYLPDDRNK